MAILGQFKRGKSTFLNALLGEPLLPTSIIPLTAIPTFIVWGAKPLIRVTYRTNRSPELFHVTETHDIRSRLYALVAEAANPKNRLEIASVELSYPADILRQGVALIDTPGVGSTHRHNTDAALNILPECDCALFVVSGDPPITEAEIEYLKLVQNKVARIIFILNKTDQMEPKDRPIAVKFLCKSLAETFPSEPDPLIFCVSALNGLKSKQSGDASALQESGMPGVEDYLVGYLAREKSASLRTAIAKKASDLLAEASADAALQVRALEMPIEDLERRRATFEQALGSIENERRVIRDLLEGDRRRAVEQLEQDAERIRQAALRHVLDVLEGALAGPDDGRAESRMQEALAAAIPAFFERELSQASRQLSHRIEEMLSGHRHRIEELVSLVRRTAADLFDIPFGAPVESEPFTLGHEPYWVTQKWNDRLIPLPDGIMKRLLPPKLRRAALKRHLQVQATELVQRNVENLRWAVLQGLESTFRRLLAELEERLVEAIDATQGVLKEAAMKRCSASDRIDGELARLRKISKAVGAAQAELARLEPKPESPTIG